MKPEYQMRIHMTPSAGELRFARDFLIKETQKQTYLEEYQALKNNQPISQKSSLIKLNPRLENGLLIMQGRLGNLYNMPEQMRHPIILPKDSRITELIILQHHQATAHSGPELTLRNVRLQFWVTGGKRQIRNALRLCQHNLCRHPNPTGQNQQIANLPIPRITPGNFEAISLDLAGPFTVKLCGICKNHKVCHDCQEKLKEKSPKSRKCSTQKAYICVFACHSSRAIHLELMMDRTSESFIMAIKRMSNRRSMPLIIHSDNASEFITAKNHIKDILTP